MTPRDPTGDDFEATLLVPGRNIWRTEAASRMRVIVDAEDYFLQARRAMMAARRRIMLIGWDFDSRIRLTAGDPGDGAPARIGPFVSWLAKRDPSLEIYLLRWDMGAVKALLRGSTPFTLIRWMTMRNIRVKLDSAHPAGASHHQKIVVIDDCLAFCGGIDMTVHRRDNRAHMDDDPKRTGPGGRYGPWHDATTAVEGPAAAALGALARERWHVAGGAPLEPVAERRDCWPEGLEPQYRDVTVGIARTRPDHGDLPPVHEIERLYLDLIAGAKRHVYAESQYFASRKVAEAIARRLAEPDPPEFVLVTPEQADGWLEQTAMDTARARLFAALKKRDPKDRLRIYHPYTAKGAPIYVHAKIMVVDDRVLRVGSSNMNNRSLRLDTECDLVLDARHGGNHLAPGRIAAMRDDLLAEHLGVAPEDVAKAIARTGSLIAAVESLRGPGRSLRPYEVPDLNAVERFLADNEVLDPEGPDEMFEPLAKRGLFRGFRLRPRAARPG